MFWHGSARVNSSQDGLVTDDPYQFQALSTSTTIRLIKVSRERVKGCIACRVYHFEEKQQESIKYHALSYLWGDPKPTRKIYLQDRGNGWRLFPLHENLWQFLDHAWRRKLFDHLFWTDHLCLDQAGHEEISQQVPRMHAIYRNAELVVIWLQLKKQEQNALRKVARLCDCPRLMPKSLNKVMQGRLFAHQDAIWGAMENPYWERVWIVQEVVVAKRVCVTTGNVSVDLDRLRALVDPFRQARFPAGKPSMWVLCDMRAAGGKMPLWKILRDFTGYQSSRPVDRVYGLLGLVADHRDGSSPAENIQVDYDRPMLHVLLDALFESSPPLTEYRLAAQCLGHWNNYDSLSLLEGYIASSTTMPRHKDFAKVALQTFEAFNIIKSVPGAPHPYRTRDLMDAIFRSASWTGWEPSWGQSAALIGLVLARWSRGTLDHWKAHRQRRGDAPSPWRCATHRSRDGGRVAPGSHQLVGFIVTWTSWGREGAMEACGLQSQSCDGTTMTCEIPGTQLRLVLKSALSGGRKGWLSFERVEQEVLAGRPDGGQYLYNDEEKPDLSFKPPR